MASTVPKRPKIYHITHIDNLAQIAESEKLWSDAKRLERDLACEIVGMSEIKRRRLEELEVSCHPGTTVGQYAPFYFCPRSIMLYILHRGNHPDVTYRGGQDSIVHLEADLHHVVSFAEEKGRRWAFCNSNAGARYARFFKSLESLEEINWSAVAATDFRDALIKDGKQAEFLLFGSFPWTLVDRIGVSNRSIQKRVNALLADASHQPLIEIKPSWYF